MERKISRKTLLTGLNPQQREAVEHTEGPLLVLAGAGSGKTRVITHRIANLIEKKVCGAENILAITFTNKAAAEMRGRLRGLVRRSFEQMTICTSHSLGNRVLREFHEQAGLGKDYTILDEHQRMAVLKSKLRQITRREQAVDLPWLGGRISYFKNAGQTFRDVPEDIEKGPLIKRAFELYERELLATRCVDFDDLLLRPLNLLRAKGRVLDILRDRYRFISIDEYQDTNPLQFELVKLLTQPQDNLCAVGDDDQGIYSWRGADIRNILTFKTTFPKAKIIKLEQNYRSTNVILRAANTVIEKNRNRTPKRMWSSKGDGEPVMARKADDEQDEAEWVCRQIRDLQQQGYALSSMALLYRNNAQSRIYEEELRRTRTSYQLLGGDSFYDSKEVRDLLAYLQFFANQRDELSLERILRVPNKGITKAAMEALNARAAAQKYSLWEAFCESSRVTLPDDDRERVRGLVDFVLHQIEKFKPGRLSQAFRALVEQTGYLAHLTSANSSDPKVLQMRLERVEELAHSIELFEARSPKARLSDYLREVVLMINEARTEVSARDAISLTTIHGSKGMEYPAVFLVGLDDELLPSNRAVEEGRLEEERRLFYVAVTRAQKRLFLSWPGSKLRYRKSHKVNACRFIRDIPQDCLAEPLGQSDQEHHSAVRDFFQQMKEKLSGARPAVEPKPSTTER